MVASSLRSRARRDVVASDSLPTCGSPSLRCCIEASRARVGSTTPDRGGEAWSQGGTLAPQEELFAVRLESRNGIQRLFLMGALVRVSVALFRHQVDGFSLEDALIVDLRYLTFLDMTGLRAIDGFLQRTVRPGSQAHLVNATARVRATFVAAGMDRLLNPDETAAVIDLSGVEPWGRPVRRIERRTMHPARLAIDETIDG